MTTDEPAVNGWQAATEAHQAAFTSAIGRSLAQQLDDLREEFNAVLLERSELAAEVNQLRQFNTDHTQRTTGYLSALTAMGKDLAAALDANDRLTRKLTDAARALAEEKALSFRLASELDKAHEWRVVDQAGLNCGSCDRLIGRGYAIKPMPGAKGYFVHVRCPGEEGRTRHARTYQLTPQGLAALKPRRRPMADLLTSTARQVRLPGGIPHELIGDGESTPTGRRYRTRCGDRLHAASGAVLTTRPVGCYDCQVGRLSAGERVGEFVEAILQGVGSHA